MFREGDPMGSFFKITQGVAAVSRTLDDDAGRLLPYALQAIASGICNSTVIMRFRVKR